MAFAVAFLCLVPIRSLTCAMSSLDVCVCPYPARVHVSQEFLPRVWLPRFPDSLHCMLSQNPFGWLDLTVESLLLSLLWCLMTSLVSSSQHSPRWPRPIYSLRLGYWCNSFMLTFFCFFWSMLSSLSNGSSRHCCGSVSSFRPQLFSLCIGSYEACSFCGCMAAFSALKSFWSMNFVERHLEIFSSDFLCSPCFDTWIRGVVWHWIILLVFMAPRQRGACTFFSCLSGSRLSFLVLSRMHCFQNAIS